MFDWLIPLLIVIALLIWLLDYLEVVDAVGGFVRLIVLAVVEIAKLVATVVIWIAQLTTRLVRYLAGWSKPQSAVSAPDAALLSSAPPLPETGSQANRGRWRGSRRQP
jgi:hypothetical protein